MNEFDLLDKRLQEHLSQQGIRGPTEAQQKAIPAVLSGKNVLLVAPTGIGKTEAAMMPVFTQLAREEGPGIRCIYITPLRALNRDLLKRLKEVGERVGLRVAVRHGDTTKSERTAQSKNPPDVLITTPETLQVLFTGRNLRKHLANVGHVIVDEIHEMAEDERGAQLSLGLERLAALSGDFQRIGLSATLRSKTSSKKADRRTSSVAPVGADAFCANASDTRLGAETVPSSAAVPTATVHK